MTKTEFIAAMAEKSGLTKKQAEEGYKAFAETVMETLQKGEKITLPGFGTFEVTERSEREGINPRTNEKIMIAASKSPKFKAGKAFKDAVNV